MNTQKNTGSPSHDSPLKLWLVAAAIFACLTLGTATRSLPALAGLPPAAFWALYALPIALCLWWYLHLNRHYRPLFFLLFPIALMAAVLVLCLLPDGLFAWRGR